MIGQLASNPLLFVISLVAILIAITIHEFSHAWVADHLGDPTPRLQGRVNLNPLSHIDPIGMLLLIFIGFGWGKPVMFDPYNLRHPKRDAAIISLAGPGSNLILAAILALVLKMLTIATPAFLASYPITYVVIAAIIQLNVFLAIFNLIPIHPLDGFKIVGGLLPDDKAREWYQLERYGIIFLLLLIIPLGPVSLLQYIITPITSFINNLLLSNPPIGII